MSTAVASAELAPEAGLCSVCTHRGCRSVRAALGTHTRVLVCPDFPVPERWWEPAAARILVKLLGVAR